MTQSSNSKIMTKFRQYRKESPKSGQKLKIKCYNYVNLQNPLDISLKDYYNVIIALHNIF